MFKVVNAGDVYVCDLGDNIGSVQSGIRPCIIVDNKNACVFSPCIHCVPLTSKMKKEIPLHYEIKKDKYNYLERDSIALCEQYTLIDKEQLQECIGSIAQIDLIKIAELCNKNLPYYYK